MAGDIRSEIGMANHNLPTHLHNIEAVYVDESMRNSSMTKRVLSRLSDFGADLPVHVIPADAGVVEHDGAGQAIYLKEYKGSFLRFCPGTRHYRCCGYRIIHIGENCPLSCSYCILQAYFQDRLLKVWANQDDLFTELGKTFGTNANMRFRVGTGEFTDSLCLEPLTGYSADLIHFLGGFPNVVLELKSKFIDLSWMDSVPRPDRVLPAWSMNAPQVTAEEEKGASSLEDRLQAARTCAENGFRVCLHFDPIIRFDGWREGYAETIDMIFDYLRPENIAYMSLGSFRHMPGLEKVIRLRHPHSRYIHNEYVVGIDGKMRLLRPLRLEQFHFLVKRLRGHGLNRQLYFCMESDEVWREVMGRVPAELDGLDVHLMRLAFGE